MAKKEVDVEEQENEEVVEKKGLSTVKIIIIVVALTIFLGGGLVGGTFYFVSSMNEPQASSPKTDTSEDVAEHEAEAEDEDDDEEEVAEKELSGPPVYHSMDPKFVVSFSNQKFARFMQFSLEIMSRDPEAITLVETHIPVIRSSLLMLFGSQAYGEMVTREGKEKLLMDVTSDINTTLQNVTGDTELESTVEAAYFTSFVIQ